MSHNMSNRPIELNRYAIVCCKPTQIFSCNLSCVYIPAYIPNRDMFETKLSDRNKRVDLCLNSIDVHGEG